MNRQCCQVSTPTNDGQTLLILAIAHAKSAETVWYLLGKGADPNLRVRTEGETPLTLAALEGNKEIICSLLSDSRTRLSYEDITSIQPNILVEILNIFPNRARAILGLKNANEHTVAQMNNPPSSSGCYTIS